MFRKDPVAVSEWSGENVEICWQRQRRIVTDIWPCLKSGGILIYSTCTYNTKETKRTSVGYGMNSGRRYCRWKFLLTGILRVIYCRERTFPPIVSCPIGRRGKDSFGSSPQTGRERWEYLGRAGEILGKGRKPQGKGAKTPGVSKEQLSALHEWFAVPDNYEFIVNGNNVSAFPKAYLSELSALRSSLRIVQAGVDVAELKGKTGCLLMGSP